MVYEKVFTTTKACKKMKRFLPYLGVANVMQLYVIYTSESGNDHVGQTTRY